MIERPLNEYTEVFAWGTDKNGMLGIGNKTLNRVYCIPRFCSFSVVIQSVSCGEEHSAFITNKGQLFTVGSNAEGRLGLGDKSLPYTSVPCLVETFSLCTVVQVSCGWGHTAAVLHNGELYTWGVGEYGALGVADTESQWFPVRVPSPKVLFKSVSCGTRHTAMIDSEGRVYSCGAGDAGQLGTGKREKVSIPTLISSLSEEIHQVDCGIFHTLMLTKTGRVCATGGNNYGQLGTGSKRSSTIPVLCKEMEKVKIIKIAAGQHSAALGDQGELFIWGTGTFGEFLLPTYINAEAGFTSPIIDVSIGMSFGMVVDIEGKIFGWGMNSNGELGLGDLVARYLPEQLTALKSKIVTAISCGGVSAIALGSTICQPDILTSPKSPISIKESVKSPTYESRTKSRSVLGTESSYKRPPRGAEQSMYRSVRETPVKSEVNKLSVPLPPVENYPRASTEHHQSLAKSANNPLNKMHIQSGVSSFNSDILESLKLEQQKRQQLEIQIMELQNFISKRMAQKDSRKFDTLITGTKPNSKDNTLLIKQHKTLQEELLNLKQEKEKYQTQISVHSDGKKLSEILKEFEEKIERQTEEKKAILQLKEREINQLKDSLISLKQHIFELIEEKNKQETDIKSKRQPLEQKLEANQRTITHENDINNELQNSNESTAKEITELQTQICNLKNKKEELIKHLMLCNNDLEELNQAASTKEKELSELDQKCLKVQELIISKSQELNLLKQTYKEKELNNYEQLKKLKIAINDGTYDNEELENKINIKKIEIDTHKKDAKAWEQVAENVNIENIELKKIIEHFEINQSSTLKRGIGKEQSFLSPESLMSKSGLKSEPTLTVTLQSYTEEIGQDSGREMAEEISIHDPYAMSKDFLEDDENPAFQNQFFKQYISELKSSLKLFLTAYHLIVNIPCKC